MAKLSRLMLLRCHNVNESENSTVLSRSGALPFAQGEPFEARPQRWHEDHGASHYAFVLAGMSDKDVRAIESFAGRDDQAGITLHAIDDAGAATVDAVLGRLGLTRH